MNHDQCFIITFWLIIVLIKVMIYFLVFNKSLIIYLFFLISDNIMWSFIFLQDFMEDIFSLIRKISYSYFLNILNWYDDHPYFAVLTRQSRISYKITFGGCKFRIEKLLWKQFFIWHIRSAKNLIDSYSCGKKLSFLRKKISVLF